MRNCKSPEKKLCYITTSSYTAHKTRSLHAVCNLEMSIVATVVDYLKNSIDCFMIPFQFGLLRNHRENQRAVEMQKKQTSNCQYNDPSQICDSALPIHRWLNMFLHIMSNCWKVCLFINVYSCHFENARRWAPKTPHFIEFVLCSTATYRPHVLALVVLFFPQKSNNLSTVYCSWYCYKIILKKRKAHIWCSRKSTWAKGHSPEGHQY